MSTPVSVAAQILSALAPQFLQGLFDPNHGEAFTSEVTRFIDRNLLGPSAKQAPDPAAAALQKLEQDPKLQQAFFEMLIETERRMHELHLKSVQQAREHRASSRDMEQSSKLLSQSFMLLVAIIGFVIVLVIVVPVVSAYSLEGKDSLLQITGAAIGFLTGIGGMFARNISAAFDYWFGSSSGSKHKTDQLSGMLSAPNWGRSFSSPFEPLEAPAKQIPPHNSDLQSFRKAMATTSMDH
ncbi:hypothetical protein [Flexibacterium corallicola]|uniref:hypothetical protein n=1 Tax=Flexibacterium corallicola TaxID=3037259 RepID=UPI00286FA7D0|nr:hypothetical protein [Pseudovibrio sp. M1P-2-3]